MTARAFQDCQDSISGRGLSPPLGTCCLTLHGSRRTREVPALAGVRRARGGRPGSHQPAGQTRRGHGILGFSTELSCEPEAQRKPHERQILELAQRFQGPALPGSQHAGPWVLTSALPTSVGGEGDLFVHGAEQHPWAPGPRETSVPVTTTKTISAHGRCPQGCEITRLRLQERDSSPLGVLAGSETEELGAAETHMHARDREARPQLCPRRGSEAPVVGL